MGQGARESENHRRHSVSAAALPELNALDDRSCGRRIWHIGCDITTIELRLNRDGGGEGTMRSAAKIAGNKEFNLIEIEDYAVGRVQLMTVRSSRPPTS